MPARGREWWAAVGATATGFFVLVAHALLETSRDALFLSNIPSTRLPWMYLTLAVLGVAVSETAARTAKRLDPRRLLIASQAIAAAGTQQRCPRNRRPDALGSGPNLIERDERSGVFP